MSKNVTTSHLSAFVHKDLLVSSQAPRAPTVALVERGLAHSLPTKIENLSLYSKLCTRHLGASYSVSDLLESYFPRKIWTSVLRFDVDAEWTEAAIVRRPQLIFGDVLARFKQTATHFLCTLDPGIERVDDSDKGNLRDAIGIIADRLADFLIHLCLVGLGRQLDQEISCIHLEHGRKESVIFDITRMY